jgi:hypothetical protein
MLSWAPTLSVCRRRAFPALLACAFGVSGCGRSTAQKQEQIVGCAGFSAGLLGIAFSPLGSSVNDILQKDNITLQDTIAMGAAAESYGAKMDPARVSRLAQEGAAAASKLIQDNDAHAIADYLQSCESTFKYLGR